MSRSTWQIIEILVALTALSLMLVYVLTTLEW